MRWSTDTQIEDTKEGRYYTFGRKLFNWCEEKQADKQVQGTVDMKL